MERRSMTTPRPPIVIPTALEPLTRERRWVVWRWTEGRHGNPTKPPFRADQPGRFASSTNAATWGDFQTAMRAYREVLCDGIGYVITDAPVAAIDLDDCRDKDTGEMDSWAANIVQRACTYCEITPSNEGLRVIGLTAGCSVPLHRAFPVPGTEGVRCELYRSASRYVTITGQQIGHAAMLANIDGLLDALYAELAAPVASLPAGQNGTPGSLSRCTSPYGNLNSYALGHLERWVPKLFPAARRTHEGGYRVSSRALGRDLQEDLSITPGGIVDWGIHDMGDSRQGRRTPITLVMEWERCGFRAAAKWLLEALG
jgi:hypothetical protein